MVFLASADYFPDFFLVFIFIVVPRVGCFFVSLAAMAAPVSLCPRRCVSLRQPRTSQISKADRPFLAGLAINRLIPERSSLMNRILFFGNQLFIPFFLLSVGMLVNVASIADLSSNITLPVDSLRLDTRHQMGLAFITRLLFGYSKNEGGVIFGLGVPKAAALAIAVVGHREGLFDDDLLNAGILLLMATCLAGPWITEFYARKVATTAQEEEAAGELELQGERAQRILVPVNPRPQKTFSTWLYPAQRTQPGTVIPRGRCL